MESKNTTTTKLLKWLFIISLLLPGLSYGSILNAEYWTGATYGIVALILGWFGIFQYLFSWYANPLLALAIRSINNGNFVKASWYSLISFVLGLQAIFMQIFGKQCKIFISTGTNVWDGHYEKINGCLTLSFIDSSTNYTLSIG